MTTLDETLRALAKRGEISHISLAPSQNGKMWRGAFAMCSKYGVSFAEDADPVQALMLACTTAKMKPRRAEKQPHVLNQTAELVSETDVDPEIAALM
jgi:hypothetical protein